MHRLICILFLMMCISASQGQDILSLPGYKVDTATDYYDGGHIVSVTVYQNNALVDCYLVGDIDYVRLILKENTSEIPPQVAALTPPVFGKIERINKTEMGELVETCTNYGANGTHAAPLEKILQFFGNGLKHMFIFPGTKWCGAGDVAKNYDDLGPLTTTDKCCRDHDQSLDYISKGGTKHGLKNDLLYTMTRCMWDEQFSTCLRDNKDPPSAVVGTLFFNILKTRCFDFTKPLRCAKKSLYVLGPCTEYEVEQQGAEKWQILDPQKFESGQPTEVIAGLIYGLPGFNDLTDVKSSIEGAAKEGAERIGKILGFR